jgi:hypothetical protein
MKVNHLFAGLLALLLLILCTTATAQTDYLGASASKLPGHPRILLLKGEEKAILKTIAADTVWAKLHKAILAESDAIIALPPVERIQIGRRLLDKSREAIRRIFYLSYAWRTTQQPAYEQRAEKEMLAIAAFSDWNPSHFLDVAEMTLAMSIGYDWCYDKLSTESRTIIRDAILNKGIKQSLDEKSNSNWLNAEHNWNQVCHTGMSYGAMAIWEDQPELGKQIINRALNFIQKPMAQYAPNGGYPEGYGYWGYGTSFNVLFVSAVEKLFGKDFELSKKPGFLGTAAFLENMTGPSGRPFNYSDAGGGGGLQPAMFWFAAKQKDPSLLWVEKSHLINDNPKQFVNDRLLPAALLWSGGAHMQNITAPKSLQWVGEGPNPICLMRTSWTDPNAVYVAMKGGSASVNHAHMDIGSFIMEADGVRWAMDFGMQDYESMESKGVQVFGRTQNAQRWSIFRYNNFVHNTLTVDSLYQQVSGYAPITSSSSAPAFMSAVTDLTTVYKDQLAKANRGIAIVDKQYVVVQDEIATLGKPTTIRWTLLTPAEVTITGSNKAELTKNGKKMVLEVQSPVPVTMKTWSTVPNNSFDAPNPGTIRTGFEVTLPANSNTTLVVTLKPGAAASKATPKPAALSNWKKD